MSRRRGRALVMTVVASAAVMAGGVVVPARGAAAAVVGSSAISATSTSPACVGLVVDARSIGSDVSTSCVKATKGQTGVQVLTAGGHVLGFRSDGLLCTIDGLPKANCAAVTTTHYWAYYQRAPGATSWVYSSEGPATYEPAAGSTEGWVYDNGRSLKPENVPYASICGCTPASSAPSPSSAPPTPPRPTSPPTSPSTHAPAATPTATTSPVGPTTRPAPPSTGGPHPGRHHRRSGGRTVAGEPAPSPPSTPATAEDPTPSPSSAALAGAVTSPSGGGHGLVDLLVVLAVVVAVGAFAVVRTRRRRTD